MADLGLTDAVTWIILLGSFAAAFINAAFATGGAFVMLAVSSSVLPVGAIVPMHSAFLYSSLVSRCIYFWRDMHWPIVIPFVLGSVIGTFVGARVYLDLPELWIALVMGSIMLVTTWMPRVRWNIPLKHPFFPIGILHSFISTVFAYGGLLHPLVLRTSLTKRQITGTLAGCLLMMGTLKIIGYVTFGFDYLQFLTLIVVATLAGFVGTWAGKRVSHNVSEATFRNVFKGIMTFAGCNLLYRAWQLL